MTTKVKSIIFMSFTPCGDHLQTVIPCKSEIQSETNPTMASTKCLNVTTGVVKTDPHTDRLMVTDCTCTKDRKTMPPSDGRWDLPGVTSGWRYMPRAQARRHHSMWGKASGWTVARGPSSPQ